MSNYKKTLFMMKSVFDSFSISVPRKWKRNHEQEAQSDDALPDQHTRGLPRSKVWDSRKGLRTHAKDVREARKDGNNVAGADKP